MARKSIKRLKRNVELIKIQKFLSGTGPLSALVVVYFETITHSYATALAVLSLSALVQGILEIPTGVFSDKIGRKNILALSEIIFFITFLFWALAGTFDYVPLLFIGGFTLGVAKSLHSGANEALMYETMVELKIPNEFGNFYSTTQGLRYSGFLLSGIIATVVTFVFNSSPQSLLVLAWLSLIPTCGEFVMFALCVEPKVIKKKRHTLSSFKHLKEAFLLMITNKKLRVFSIFRIGVEISGKGSDKIAPAYYAELIPLYWVAIISIMKYLLSAISYHLISYFRILGFGKLIFASEYLILFVKFVGLVIGNFLTPFIMTTSNVFSALSDVSQVALLQNKFSKEQRATMASIISLLSAFGSAIFLYIIGGVVDAYSFGVSLFIVILMKLLMVIFLSCKLKKL